MSFNFDLLAEVMSARFSTVKLLSFVINKYFVCVWGDTLRHCK